MIWRMERSCEILRETVARCGAKAVAAELGLSQSLIYKWCQSPEGEGSGADNPLDRLLALCEATDAERPVDWLCERLDSFRVRNPAPEGDVAESVLDATQIILKEFSDMLEAVTQSYDNGHRIDLDEAARIRKEWEELKRVGEHFVRSCESGVFDRRES